MHENEEGWGRSASHAKNVELLVGFMFIALIPFLMTKGSLQGTVPQAMLFPALSLSASLIVIWICLPSGSADSC